MQRLLLAFLALLLLAHPAPAAAQRGPDALLPGQPPPAPPALAAAPAQTLACAQALADPTVSVSPQPESASPWQAFRGSRSFVADITYSPPRALLLPAAPATVGQQVSLAATAAADELAGALRYRIAPGAAPAGATLRVELYASPSLDAAGLIARRDLDVAALDDGTWRAFEWEVLDADALQRLRGLSSFVFAVSTLNTAGGAVPQLWLDDLTLNLCRGGGSIFGQVRKGAAPAPDADLLLVRADAAGARVFAAARSDAAGGYRFAGVPALPAGASYRVWFVNAPAGVERDAARLGFWAGPTLTTFAEGASAGPLDLNVADAPLLAPAPYGAAAATDAAPAELSWGARAGAAPGERHRMCLYDPELAAPPAQAGAAPRPLELCGPLLDPAADRLAFALSPGSFAAAPGFGFRYGRPYRWYVVVCGDPACQQYGYSFFERVATFFPAAPGGPGVAPTLPPGDPAPGAADADWTLLVYVAADNALGDPARVPRSARPLAQLAGLPAAAAAFPRINLVSYVDGFGPSGAALCAYPPGAPADCRARPEPDTGSTQPLAELIQYGRARYPAARTALLIVAPANAAGELATDESAGGGVLTLAELSAALAAGVGSAPLDLVIYQAPTLGTLEVARATEPHARAMVAAADQIWQIGAADRVASALAAAGRADGATAARGVVLAYQAALDAVLPGRAFSMAAYDLARAGAVISAADDLALTARSALDAQRATLLPALEAARGAAQRYDSSGNGRHDRLQTAAGPVPAAEDALVDLRGLAQALRDAPAAPADVRDLAGRLLNLLAGPTTSPVIASVQRPGLGLAGAPLAFADAGGLAIFFPSGERLGGQQALAQSYLYGPPDVVPGVSDWAPLLRSYLRDRIGQGPGGVTAGPDGGAQLRPLTGGLVQTDLRLPLVRR
jgi:hypothetical protein